MKIEITCIYCGAKRTVILEDVLSGVLCFKCNRLNWKTNNAIWSDDYHHCELKGWQYKFLDYTPDVFKNEF